VHGAGGSGNDDCSPEEELPMNTPTTVRIDVRQTHVEVFYGTAGSEYSMRMRCTEPRSQVN
jgi:hypothetical protein